MAYRDEQSALEQRARALREEIGELLAQLEAREHTAFLKRAGDYPPPLDHRRQSISSSMRWPAIVVGGFVAFAAVVALTEPKPTGERFVDLASVCIIGAFVVGIANLFVRFGHNRAVDLHLDEDGLCIERTGTDVQLPWQDVERLHFVAVPTGNPGTRYIDGALALRVDGVWTEYPLSPVTRSTLSAIHEWEDWVLGVQG